MDMDEILSNLKLNPDASEFSTQSWYKGYWWGVEWYLTKAEADIWQNRFADYSFAWGSIAAITGLLAVVFPKAVAASIAAIIMSVGNYHMMRIIRDNKSSRGTIVTFKWAPPSVTARKR
ncbi:hypothetical protein CEN49_27330 [Fischerella thermalis CCMEE 5273]|nr:hypothetical protein CEN49_27330 [Fischerella thermalis CCMEE 5273]